MQLPIRKMKKMTKETRARELAREVGVYHHGDNFTALIDGLTHVPRFYIIAI